VARLGASNQGSVQLTVVPGDSDPTNGDQADVSITGSITDVQTVLGGDYNPNVSGSDLHEFARFRITDRANGFGGVSATTTDLQFAVPLDCQPSGSPTVGSTCATTTSADAVMPGFAEEGRAAIIQQFRIQVYDAGQDGVPQNADDRLLAQQGVFVP
jgi:hypothetical protein